MRSIHAPQACITGEACITHTVRISFRKERITQKSPFFSVAKILFLVLVAIIFGVIIFNACNVFRAVGETRKKIEEQQDKILEQREEILRDHEEFFN